MWAERFSCAENWNRQKRAQSRCIHDGIELPHFQSNLLWLLQIDALEAEETFRFNFLLTHTPYDSQTPLLDIVKRGKVWKGSHGFQFVFFFGRRILFHARRLDLHFCMNWTLLVSLFIHATTLSFPIRPKKLFTKTHLLFPIRERSYFVTKIICMQG